jgi:glycosyltransferase involved in cell wall biosynthesis
MKLLVVTPTLGESPWLAETVASVIACAPNAAHVLVAPERAVADLARRFPRARVVPERGGGMYAALNTGLAVSEPWDAFTYLNDDDLLLPEFAAVTRVLEAHDAGTRGAISYGGVRLIGADGRRLGAIPISRAPGLNRALYAERLEPVYQHGTVVTRTVIEAIGPFDATLRFCGDSEFLARACVRHVGFICATRAEVAAFRLRAGQLTKNRAAMRAERMRVDEKLGLLAGETGRRRRWARLVFRATNVVAYGERIARHGFISFDELLTRGG